MQRSLGRPPGLSQGQPPGLTLRPAALGVRRVPVRAVSLGAGAKSIGKSRICLEFCKYLFTLYLKRHAFFK